MPISPMQFQPLSFEQANPFMAGMMQGNQFSAGLLDNQLKNLQNQAAGVQNQYLGPSLAAALQKQQLANQMQAPKSALAQQFANADLAQQQALPGLTTAKTGLANAQAGLAGQQSQWVGPQAQASIAEQRAQAGYLGQEARFAPFKAAGNLDPLTKMIYGRALLSQGGIGGAQSGLPGLQGGAPGNGGTPMQAPGQSGMSAPGGPVGPGMPASIPTIGGGGVPAGAPSVNDLYSMQLKYQLDQMGKDPTTGNYRSGAGATYLDPFTGKQYSTDTMTNVTQDQRTTAAVQRVAPILGRLSSELSPFQTASGDARLLASKAGNYLFGMNNPSANSYAQGKADLKVAPESLLKAWGLNVTNDSLERMEEAVKPRPGESGKGYQARIVSTLQDLQNNQQQAEDRLAGGTKLTQAQASGAAPATAANPVPEMTKVIGGKTYHKVNGQWYQE